MKTSDSAGTIERSEPFSTLSNPANGALSSPASFLFAAGAVVCFHLAFQVPALAFLIVGFLFCLVKLLNVASPRRAFYLGLLVGLAIYAPQLSFFWNIFHAAAIPLWLVLSFWLATFLLAGHLAQRRLSQGYVTLLLPFLWMAFEFFRSELYYLRFSWLSVGYVFASLKGVALPGFLGVYGLGFCLMLVAVLLASPRRAMRGGGVALIVAIVLLGYSHNPSEAPVGKSIQVSGVQLEFREEDVVSALERVREKFPQTDLYVLSEYTFADPPSKFVRKWCRDHKTYLIAGGKEFTPDQSDFYNTAFVVGPDGEFIFKQVKSVPIQFFKDGLPAPKQELWHSPWGKIGICICYDLSYRRVVDKLIALGAEALVVPTMDVVDWGQHQHELHGRIAPMRASEYQVPIFRLCSSGISQAVDRHGNVIASAGFPGEGEMMTATLNLRSPGRLPLDRWAAPFSVVITGGFILWLVFRKFASRPVPLKKS